MAKRLRGSSPAKTFLSAMLCYLHLSALYNNGRGESLTERLQQRVFADSGLSIKGHSVRVASKCAAVPLSEGINFNGIFIKFINLKSVFRLVLGKKFS